MLLRTRPLRLVIAALVLGCCAAAPAPAPEARAQRSANLSHITGTSRNIQMFLKNRYLQLLPDGTVNGTTDGSSVYTILQRATYRVGLLTIQGVSTCLYLCMDACGFQYAHKDLSDDCMFDEHLEANNYNTYSRIRNGKKTFLALDNRGHPRRVQIPAGRPLGNLSSYALTLTKRWDVDKHTHQCPAKRHRGKMKRPPPFHRNCARRLQKQNLRQKRKNKKAHDPKKKNRHPKTRRKLENPTTTTESWEESTTFSTTTDVEFFRSTTAREAVGQS